MCEHGRSCHGEEKCDTKKMLHDEDIKRWKERKEEKWKKKKNDNEPCRTESIDLSFFEERNRFVKNHLIKIF